MPGQIPPEGFSFYLALGAERSYAQVAKEYGVSKQAVTKCARRERWQERLDEIELQARERNDKKAVETLQELNEHQLKLWKLVETRAVQALQNHPLDSGMDGAKALDLATKNIRLIRGEPTDRTESIEQIIRRESERFLTTSTEDDWGEEDAAETG
jgi:hypothetical protein